jgi:hypothetical protein
MRSYKQQFAGLTSTAKAFTSILSKMVKDNDSLLMCCQERETAMVVGESIQFCAQISIVF